MQQRLNALLNQLLPLASQASFKIRQSELFVGDVNDDYSGIIDDRLFDVGFSRRYFFDENPFLSRRSFTRLDIAHSSIFLQPIDSYTGLPTNKPMTFGRLPPAFKKIGRVKHNPLKTKISEESRFWFQSGRPFEVIMPAPASRIVASGREIKAALMVANQYICEGQIGDFVHSNCYSASMVVYAELVCILSSRVIVTPNDRLVTAQAISGLLGIIQRYSTDHGGIGVANNTLVLQFIQKAITWVNQQGYGHLLHHNPAPLRRFAP